MANIPRSEVAFAADQVGFPLFGGKIFFLLHFSIANVWAFVILVPMLEAEAEQGHVILEEKNKKRHLAAQQAAILDNLQLNTHILPSSILFFVPCSSMLAHLDPRSMLKVFDIGGRKAMCLETKRTSALLTSLASMNASSMC